jgi:hypothetical protein
MSSLTNNGIYSHFLDLLKTKSSLKQKIHKKLSMTETMQYIIKNEYTIEKMRNVGNYMEVHFIYTELYFFAKDFVVNDSFNAANGSNE